MDSGLAASQSQSRSGLPRGSIARVLRSRSDSITYCQYSFLYARVFRNLYINIVTLFYSRLFFSLATIVIYVYVVRYFSDYFF